MCVTRRSTTMGSSLTKRQADNLFSGNVRLMYTCTYKYAYACLPHIRGKHITLKCFVGCVMVELLRYSSPIYFCGVSGDTSVVNCCCVLCSCIALLGAFGCVSQTVIAVVWCFVDTPCIWCTLYVCITILVAGVHLHKADHSRSPCTRAAPSGSIHRDCRRPVRARKAARAPPSYLGSRCTPPPCRLCDAYRSRSNWMSINGGTNCVGIGCTRAKKDVI